MKRATSNTTEYDPEEDQLIIVVSKMKHERTHSEPPPMLGIEVNVKMISPMQYTTRDQKIVLEIKEQPFELNYNLKGWRRQRRKYESLRLFLKCHLLC